MTAAIEEFLTENSLRRYPLSEDCSVQHSGEGTLDSDVLLDLRGWHRGRPTSAASLLAIVGPEGAGAGAFVANAGHTTFYFGSGADEVVWSAPLPAAAPEVTTLVCKVADPFYPEVNLGILRVTFGLGAQGIPADATWLFTAALIEPGLVVAPFRNQVDVVKIIHRDTDDEIVGGDVEIVGGYNFNVVPEAQGLRLSPEAGGGTLGRFVGSLASAGESKCNGALLSFGQVVPDKDTRDLKIVGKNGIEVINFPEQSKIRIKVAPQHFGGSVCA